MPRNSQSCFTEFGDASCGIFSTLFGRVLIPCDIIEFPNTSRESTPNTTLAWLTTTPISKSLSKIWSKCDSCSSLDALASKRLIR